MLVRTRDFLWNLSPVRLALTVSLVVFLKVGMQRSDGIDTFTSQSQSIEEFTSFYRSSPIMRVVAQLFPLDTEFRWVLFHLLVTGLFLVVVYVSSISMFPKAASLGLILVLFSPIVTVAFTEVGRYDIYLLIGSFLLVSSGWVAGLLGGALIFFANFEQGLIVLVSIAVLAMSKEIIFDRRRVFSSMIFGALASFAYMAIAYSGQSGSDSRLDALERNLKGAALANFTSLPLLAFSTLGIFWLALFYWFSRSNSMREMVLQAVAIFVIPFIATYFTLDGTRVFVWSSAVPILITLNHIGHRAMLEDSAKKQGFTALLIAGSLLPMFSVFVDGYVKEPYIEVYRFFQG